MCISEIDRLRFGSRWPDLGSVGESTTGGIKFRKPNASEFLLTYGSKS